MLLSLWPIGRCCGTGHRSAVRGFVELQIPSVSILASILVCKHHCIVEETYFLWIRLRATLDFHKSLLLKDLRHLGRRPAFSLTVVLLQAAKSSLRFGLQTPQARTDKSIKILDRRCVVLAAACVQSRFFWKAAA